MIRSLLSAILLLTFTPLPLRADEPAHEEFRIDREEEFRFATPPEVVREGRRYVITFETRGRCDVTVAIEDGDSRIIRHLASGVLGPNAPTPLQKNTLRQRLIWDGKNDAGRYVDHLDDVTVRVSLGLQPRFERTLFWSPHKRTSGRGPLLTAAPEGIYITNGKACDQVRLFDHAGDYVRTVFPFPRRQLEKVQGLAWHGFPHSGTKRPLKGGFHQAALLTSGNNRNIGDHHTEGRAAEAVAIHGDKLALLYFKLNRLSNDGATWGPGLE
jgi:hypothetical protein